MLLSRQHGRSLITIITFLGFMYPVFADTITTPAPVSGRNPNSTRHIIPADVLARVKLLYKELNLIRKALGKPKETNQIIRVQGASPREVYFEAQALFEKANRLAFEVTGSYKKLPEIHSDDLQPVHVWSLVNDGLKRILLVKKWLKIKTTVKESREPETTTPTNVFNAIIVSNSELNQLLTSRMAPKDVFREVTLAVNYTANLLQYLNIKPRIPNATKHIRDVTYGDVFKKLLTCIELLEQISKVSKVKMLDLKVQYLSLPQITSSDLYDLSKIIVSEVRYLNHVIKKTTPVESFDPGYKTPSDIYQRVTILETQLNLLLTRLKTEKDGLK